MKQLLLLVSLAFVMACSQQKENVLCHSPASFADLAEDPSFKLAHPSPEEANFKIKGKMVKIAIAGQDSARAYVAISKRKTTKYLLVFHEWWGLNDYVKREADMWSKTLNVNAIAVDLYDGKVATTPEDAGKLMQAVDAKRSESIIGAAANYAGPMADFRTIGWCFGGGWSLKAALQLKEKAKACVMYYGMPVEDVELLKKLSPDVVFIHPNQDRWINADMVGKFEANMKAAGKKVTVHHYDADHAFANPSSPHYNDQAAKDSRKVVEAYLKAY